VLTELLNRRRKVGAGLDGEDRRRGGRRRRGPAGAGLPRIPGRPESDQQGPAETMLGIRGAEAAAGERIEAAALVYLWWVEAIPSREELELGFW